MARSQPNAGIQFVKWAGAAAAAIVGGVAIGYLFGNARVTHPPVTPEPPPVSATLPPSPAVSPSSIHPHVSNGNYTAPGAPHIVIEEESQPILRRVTPPPTPPPDPEATQEATTPTPAAPPAEHAVPADSASATHSGTSPVSVPAGPSDTNSGSPAPSVPAPAAPPPAPADPDFEHVNGAAKSAPNPGAPDPEAGQQGGHGQGDSGKSQFRVQTGAYIDESNARSVADTLRSEGYATSTRSERNGDHLVYKVQVGAYRSRNGADKAADDLQKKGYPAFISPISP